MRARHRKLFATIVLLSALGLGAGAAGGEPMRMQDAITPVFVAAVPANPGPALDTWLDATRGKLVKLPVTVWRGPLGQVEHAAVGVHDARPSDPWRLDDSALGIALVDRLRATCGDDARCVVWISGVPTAPRTLAVRGVDGRVAPDSTVYAEEARPTDCLVIRSQKPIHCARGPRRCDSCRDFAAQPARPVLLDVCPQGEVARPVITLVRDGNPTHRPYDTLRVFTDEAEARKFATEHGIDDAVL